MAASCGTRREAGLRWLDYQSMQAGLAGITAIASRRASVHRLAHGNHTRHPLPAGATVSELLSHLGIPMSKIPVVTYNGRILQAADIIQPDSTLHIFQPVAGG